MTSTIKKTDTRLIDTFNGARVYKSMNMVYITFEATTPFSKAAGETLFTLPVGCRPAYPVSFIDPLQNARISIGNDGNVTCNVATNSNIRGGISFLSDC